MDGGLDRTRNLIWVASGTDDDCCEIHRHLGIGEEDGWLRCIFQNALGVRRRRCRQFPDRFLEFPADLKLLSKNVLAWEEAVHESVIDDGDVRGAGNCRVLQSRGLLESPCPLPGNSPR